MNIAILHSFPLLDASLDSATLSWLIGGLAAALVILILGVLATAPARRATRLAALAKPAETLASPLPAPAVETSPPTPAALPETAAAAPVAPSEPASSVPAPVVAVPASPVPAPAAEPEFDSAASSPSNPLMPVVDFVPPGAPVPPIAPAAPAPISPEPVFAPEASQPAIPIPVGPDFSASGPIILPSSVVAATFGAASEPAPVTTGPLMLPAEAAPPASDTAPSSSVSGPLIPPLAPAAPETPAVPFVVTPVEAEPEPEPEPMPAMVAPVPAPASLSSNGTGHVERVPLPDAVDLFAHGYGRTNAAMLSATERAAASRIARALHDDPTAVQLAAMFAAETHRPLDTLAQSLEADRRNRLERADERHAVSDADALDVFAGSYGRTNAAMLSATERAAASRIVRALGDDPLAVRLAGMYAGQTQHPLDTLANRLETDVRHTSAQNGHQA